MPRESAAIHRIFHLKYPALASTPWIAIENRSEGETAEILGHSAVLLSLPFLESLGLVPLEAMACGAIVAGFDGYGGREYATAENGVWLPSDHLEEAADALALLIQKIARNDPAMARMREAVSPPPGAIPKNMRAPHCSSSTRRWFDRSEPHGIGFGSGQKRSHRRNR